MTLEAPTPTARRTGRAEDREPILFGVPGKLVTVLQCSQDRLQTDDIRRSQIPVLAQTRPQQRVRGFTLSGCHLLERDAVPREHFIRDEVPVRPLRRIQRECRLLLLLGGEARKEPGGGGCHRCGGGIRTEHRGRGQQHAQTQGHQHSRRAHRSLLSGRAEHSPRCGGAVQQTRVCWWCAGASQGKELGGVVRRNTESAKTWPEGTSASLRRFSLLVAIDSVGNEDGVGADDDCDTRPSAVVAGGSSLTFWSAASRSESTRTVK